MFKLFDGKYDGVELFLIILLMTSLLAFLIYIIISNKKNSLILLDNKNSLRKFKNTLRINFKDETVKIYDNNKRILLATYTFNEFKSLVDFRSIDIFEEWLNKIKEKDSSKNSIGIYLLSTTHSSKHYIKLNLLNFNRKTKEAYISMEELNRSIQFSTKLLDNKTFFKSIYSLAGYRKKSLRGCVVLLKLTNMSFLRKRYGNENANILLGEMFNRIAEINDNEDVFATYLQNNVFCIFKKDIKDRRQAKSYVIDLISTLVEEPVNILNKQVEPTVDISYTLYGEKTYDIKTAINLVMKSFGKSSFKFGKNRYSYYDVVLENDNTLYSKEVERLQTIIENQEVKVKYEPVLCVEQMDILGYVIHTKFDFMKDDDTFLTVLNACEKYGFKNEFLNMYYRKVFNECLNENPKGYRMILKVDITHLDIIKSIWLENINYAKIRLSLLVNYEDIIHPKKQINFNNIIEEFSEFKLKFALSADENMLTIVSNVVNSIDLIVFDEFLISNLEANDLKQISIDNIINNTQSNKMKYIAYGINKFEEAEVLNKLGVDNITGPYISKPLDTIQDLGFLKNRSVQALSNDSDM